QSAGRLDLQQAVEAPGPGDDAAIQPLGVISAGQVDDLVHLGVAVEQLQELAVAAAFNYGVYILEDAHDGARRLHLAETGEGRAEPLRVLAEEGDVPGGRHPANDLVDQRRLAAALLAVEQITASVDEAQAGETLAH